MKFEEAIEAFAGQPLTRQILQNVLRDYRRPYDKLSELIKQEALISIKRGIYIPRPDLKIAARDLFF